MWWWAYHRSRHLCIKMKNDCKSLRFKLVSHLRSTAQIHRTICDEIGNIPHRQDANQVVLLAGFFCCWMDPRSILSLSPLSIHPLCGMLHAPHVPFHSVLSSHYNHHHPVALRTNNSTISCSNNNMHTSMSCHIYEQHWLHNKLTISMGKLAAAILPHTPNATSYKVCLMCLGAAAAALQPPIAHMQRALVCV